MRITVGLKENQDPAAVAEALRQQGAQYIHEEPALPGVVVAEFPEGDARQVVENVQKLPGVRYAEPDAMRTTLD